MYKLTKLRIKQDKASFVTEGTSQESKECYLIIDNDNHTISPDLKDIKEDMCILVYFNTYSFIRTSPIIKINSLSDNIIEFQTQTSVYELEKLSDI